MKKDSISKSILIQHIQNILNGKLNELKLSMDSSKQSRDSETKSSVGDKYETGRAMLAIEIEKNEVQISKTQKLLHELSQIQVSNNTTSEVNFGSIVFTDSLIYFISIPLGKIIINNQTIYCISQASPIGQLLFKKKAGESISFQGQNIFVKEVE